MTGDPGVRDVRIREFQPLDGDAFRRLNEEWLHRYFALEKKDRELLGDPEGHVLSTGGVILIAEVDGEPVGCCAMLNKDADTFEVAKMAVTASRQGRGLGRALLGACIEKAKSLGKRRLFLETNSRLEAAIALYRGFGFVELPPEAAPPSEYARVDMVMELDL